MGGPRLLLGSVRKLHEHQLQIFVQLMWRRAVSTSDASADKRSTNAISDPIPDSETTTNAISDPSPDSEITDAPAPKPERLHRQPVICDEWLPPMGACGILLRSLRNLDEH